MANAERTGNLTGLRIMAGLIPFGCGMLGVIIANLPVSFLGGLVPAPLVALVPVYYWCLVRPDLMTPAATFVIGLCEDILSGAPPGMWTLSFVLTYGVVERQRDSFAGLSGWGAILGFATAALVACLSAYTIVALYYWHMPLLAPILGEFAMTVLFYAPVTFLLGILHHRLIGPLRSDF